MKNSGKLVVSQNLLADITNSLRAIDSHGSVEIFVADCKITQITVRNIKKTSHSVKKTLDKAISIY